MKKDLDNIEFIIHRGSHQIGGNCVELVAPNSRILIDCGLPLDYDEQDPETQKEIRENARKWLNNCDAIFLSHYHGDHYGLLCEAPLGTKVFTSDETAMLMELSGIFGEDLTQRLDIHTFENGVITFKDFRITQYIVDHSAYGACAFLFEVDGKRILYSGDIRLHGKKGILYKHLPQHVDYLFLEGTNLGRGVRQKSEDDVRDEFIQQFNSHPDSAFLVWCSAQNIDRTVALYRACVNSKRNLCIDPYTAYVLNLVNQCNDKIPSTKNHSNLLVYYPNRFCSRLKDKRGDIHKEIVANSTKIQNDDPQKNPSKYVFVFRPNLLDFFRKHLASTSIRFIVSMWAQYWDKDTPDLKRFKNWLAAEPELRKRLPDIHTSGHADMASLQKIVEHVQPKCIVPIHTEMPEKYKTLFPSYTVLNATDETPIELINTKE